jgi:type II restriction/modification system DNA methylase subunit YeeA
LVAPELPLERRNYLLLLFARGQKLRETLLRLAQEGWWEIVQLAYLLHPKESSEVLVMSRKYPTLEENIRFIVRDLGAEKLLREIVAMMDEDPELAERLSSEMVRGLGAERLLRGIAEELGRERIEQLLREMDEEQKRKRTDGRRRSRKQGR